MNDCIQRMQKQHARSGKTHHLFNFQPHIFLITMDSAQATGRFIFSKRALFQSLQRIPTQCNALFAQFLAGTVSGTTINSNHLANNLFFPFVHLFSLNRSVKIAIFFLSAKQNHLISFTCSVVTYRDVLPEDVLFASVGGCVPVVFLCKQKGF